MAGMTIGIIELYPSYPELIAEGNPTVNSEIPVSNTDPVVVSESLGARSLRLEGETWRNGYGLANLAGTIDQLGSYNKGTVAITSSPISRLNGTWLMTNFDYSIRAEGGQAKIYYSMEFKVGGSFLIL